MTRTTFLSGLLLVAACSSSSTPPNSSSSGSSSGGGPAPDGGASSSGATTGPCGGASVYGTFTIDGTLDGTESICGLSLGSFSGATLSIVEPSCASCSSPSVEVSVASSGAGHIDVGGCAATIAGCQVTVTSCPGEVDKNDKISLDLSVTGNTVSGQSNIAVNGCQAPGLTFTGNR